MKIILPKSLLAGILLLLLLPVAAMAQVNGEYRSAATGVWATAATWETYSTATSSWSTASVAPTGTAAIITVRNGHVITLATNHSFKKLTVASGGSVISDGTERRLDMVGDTSAIINNGNIGGILNSNDSKLNIANSATCTIGTISGTGTTSIVRVRFNTSTATVTNLSTLVIDQDMTILSSGLTAYYNNATNTAAENCVLTINAGRTVTASGALHASVTPVGPGGSYTYNINGTLDMSATSTVTTLHPMVAAASTVTINVAGIWKVNKLDATYTGTNAGNVVLKILNGGLVDATKSTAFTLGSRYFITSGNGKLKRAVPTTSTTGIVFPIGTSATSYNPVTITPGAANDTFAVNVDTALSYPIGNASRIVNKQWSITPTVSGAGFNTTFGWQTADQAAGFSQTAPLRIFSYSAGPPAGWAPVATAAPITGAGTIASPYITGPVAAPTAISGLYVVGDSDAAVVVIPTVSITGTPGSPICAGTQVIFTAATTNITGAHYQWKVNGSNVGIDSVKYATTSLTNGAVVTVTISYTVGGPAAATSNSITMVVNPLPVAGTLTGSGSVCTGTTEVLTPSVTGGVWSSSNTAVATVSTSGVVTGVTVGTVTISYAVTNSCGTATATKVMAVTLGASAGTVTGTAAICPGATTTLASSAPGGTWISPNTSVATVSATGVVTGVSAGTVAIAYVVTNGCGTDTARRTITVNPAPNAGTITGSSTVCIGSTITLSSAVTGGTWSSNNGNATVSGGVVSGVTKGTSVITYTVTNTCGSAAATYNVTISTVPTTANITGPSTVCTGTTITLTDSTSGGVWSNANSSVITVSAAGIVTGVQSGSDVVTYTVTNACGSASATKTITVASLPTAATLTGPDSVCLSAIITLATDIDNGIWSSTNKKTVITTDGIVTGITVGLDTVIYNLTNQCGTTKTAHVVEVWNCNPLGIGNAFGKSNLLATVYPNPNTGSFVYVLSAPRTETLKLVITNMMGAVVATKTAKTNERISVDLNAAAGMYFLTAITDEGRTMTKVNITK